MSKKIGLHFGGKRFDIDVDDHFSSFLKEQMSRDFNIEGNNDIKVLLQAYIRKNYELYENEKRVAALLEKIEKSF